MSGHVYHPALPGYDEEAILHDGCPECEDRADRGVDGLLFLDDSNIVLLWHRVLNTEYGGSVEPNDAGHYRSKCEARIGHALYLVGVFVERHRAPAAGTSRGVLSGDDSVWHLDAFNGSGVPC